MFRPSRLVLSIFLLAAGLALSACRTTYSDIYSYKRSRFVPPPHKAELPPAPKASETPAAGAPDPAAAVLGTAPAPAPAAAPAAPVIPGL